MSDDKKTPLIEKRRNVDKAEFYMPPNRLAEVIRPNVGHTLREMEVDAEKRLSKLGESYPQIVREAVAAMKSDLAKTAPFKERIETIYIRAHDLKGQAGTFGYTLVGEVGKSLCAAIRTEPDLLENEPDILRLHINAIAWALEHEHDEQVSAQKSELVNSLRQSIKKGL